MLVDSLQTRRRTPLDWDQIEGNWKQFKGRGLTEKVQERYGLAKDQAE
jgi:uncharacterized protein YjbJ (UPF0337 family)